MWETFWGRDNWCGVLKKSRWYPWTVSKTQGSLLITTQFNMECFRWPARGRWLTTNGLQSSIIPGSKWGLPTGWMEGLGAGPLWHSFLSPWMGPESWCTRIHDWHHPIASLICWKGWCALEKLIRTWAGFNPGLKSLTKQIFASLWKLFRGKRWNSLPHRRS